MEKMIETVSLLNDEDKKKILELANILLKQNKYNELRKEIEARRSEVRKGEVLSHEEIWRDKWKKHLPTTVGSFFTLKPITRNINYTNAIRSIFES